MDGASYSMSRKVYMGIVIVVLAILYIIFMYQSITFHSLKPTPMMAHMNRNKNVFDGQPAITICPGTPYINGKGISSQQDYTSNGVWVSDSNPESRTPKMVFDESVYPLDQLLKSFSVTTEIKLPADMASVYNVSDKVCEEEVFTAKESRQYGMCYSMFLPYCITRYGILEIELVPNTQLSQLYVMVHTNNAFLEPKPKERLIIDTNTPYRYGLRYEVTKSLSFEDNCNDENDMDGCIYQALESEALKEYSCTAPWVKNREKICTNATIGKKVLAKFQETLKSPYETCNRPCINTRPTIHAMSTDIDQDDSIIFVIDHEVVMYQEYLLSSSQELVLRLLWTFVAFFGIGLLQVFLAPLKLPCCKEAKVDREEQ